MAVTTNGDRVEVPGAPGYWLIAGHGAGELPPPTRRLTLQAAARLGEGNGEPKVLAVLGPRGVPVCRARIVPYPAESIATFEFAATAIAPEAAVLRLLEAVLAEASHLGVTRFFVLVPLDQRFGIELLQRAGLVLESVLTEGGVAEVAFRVPTVGLGGDEAPA